MPTNNVLSAARELQCKALYHQSTYARFWLRASSRHWTLAFYLPALAWHPCAMVAARRCTEKIGGERRCKGQSQQEHCPAGNKREQKLHPQLMPLHVLGLALIWHYIHIPV